MRRNKFNILVPKILILFSNSFAITGFKIVKGIEKYKGAKI